jgi:glucosamine-6-phosphate deaminase
MNFQVDHLSVTVYPDAEALARAAADSVANTIRTAIKQQGHARVIFATGNSQLRTLSHLIQQRDIDWTKVTAFHLDEYIGLSITHPASFRHYLQARLFSQLPFAQVHLLNGEAPDPQVECERYSALLQEAPIDLACAGIGENGHLAFNDPPADFTTSALVHVVTLDTACRLQQVGEGHFPTLDDVPKQALSLTVPAILAARQIACIVPEARKAEPVRRTLREPVSQDCPASILRSHPGCHLFLDRDSAGQGL